MQVKITCRSAPTRISVGPEDCREGSRQSRIRASSGPRLTLSGAYGSRPYAPSFLGPVDLYLRPFFAFSNNFLLTHFDVRCFWCVFWNNSSIAQTVNVPFFTQIVFIQKASSVARNHDSKFAWMDLFNFRRCQWPKPRTAFHDGTLDDRTILRSGSS